jgi:L-lactate utilization protein LutB
VMLLIAPHVTYEEVLAHVQCGTCANDCSGFLAICGKAHVPTILAGCTISLFGQGSRCTGLNGSIDIMTRIQPLLA